MRVVNLEAFVILLRLIDPINQIVQQRLRPQSHYSQKFRMDQTPEAEN